MDEKPEFVYDCDDDDFEEIDHLDLREVFDFKEYGQ